jgi:gas vesicle protein GvpL/GvpF
LTVSDLAGVREDIGLFVYAVVPADRRMPEDVTGVDGSPLSVVVHRDIGAVVGPMSLDRPPGRRADLTAYSTVMEALLPGGPVAPLRFGCVVPDRDVVVSEVLEPRADDLAVLLEDLTGRAQFNLQVTFVEAAILAEIVAADPQIRALRERTRGAAEGTAVGERIRLGELVAHAWEHWARQDADRLLDELLPMVVGHRLRREPGAEVVLDAALLVDSGRSQELEDRLEHLAADSADRLRFRLVGPLAAYDFVGSI